MMESFDVVIVGAGIWGLCAAQTFLAIDSSLSLLIIDSKQSLGGVWATEQLYPGLRTNGLQGFYEFSHFPLVDAGVGVKPRGIMSGVAIHEYLEKYAEHFDLKRRVQSGTTVLRAVEHDDKRTGIGWELELGKTGHPSGNDVSFVSCRKLLLATGQASTPYEPSFTGRPSFGRPVIHSIDLGRHGASLISDSDIKNVTVVGGSKSAHDAVYMFATAGKRVNWIIHSTQHGGRGAVPMGKAFSQMGPWAVWVEGLLMFRPLTWFGAAPWSDGDGFGWIRWFLHGTKLGNSLVKGYYAGMSGDMIQQSGILDDEKTMVLLPAETMLWYGTQANSLNYDKDLYDLVKSDRISITLGNIDHLEEGRVHLGEKIEIETDALILATGYDYSASVPLEPVSRRLGWGCPIDPSKDTIYPDLDVESDKEILFRFPLLRTSPTKPERLPSLSPWRLWRFLAPPSQVPEGETRRNLVFLNAITSYQTFIKCELTSLWAYAYLYDRLDVRSPSEQEARREISLWTRFGKWRAPYGMQGKFADFMFDAMPYYDLLLRDLGLQSWRKGRGWFGEVFGRWYEPKDYKGVVQEWMTLQAGRAMAEKKDL